MTWQHVSSDVFLNKACNGLHNGGMMTVRVGDNERPFQRVRDPHRCQLLLLKLLMLLLHQLLSLSLLLGSVLWLLLCLGGIEL